MSALGGQTDICSPWIARGFVESLQRVPERPAVEVDGRVLSYAELFEKSSAIAVSLEKADKNPRQKLTAVLAARSETAFTGILAAILRGHGYVPLNPSFPPDRIRYMLRQSGCSAIVVDENGEKVLASILNGMPQGLTLVFPEARDPDAIKEKYAQHQVLTASDLQEGKIKKLPRVGPDDMAYLLFTSGSTGNPKGVMVSHANIDRFLTVVSERYRITQDDRLSHMFDLVFDLSVFDLFAAWHAGACVCCPSHQQVLLPTEYIRESKISIWFSVPSVAVLMSRLRQLTPDAFPELRVSLFCGEAMPADVIDPWQMAAPKTVVENLYGPTEVTLACMFYRWDEKTSPADCENGVVPIGEPFPGMSVMVTDDALDEVAVGAEGELLMSGPQVALGYLNDEEKTAAAFVRVPSSREIHYRTGDLVRRPRAGEPMKYLGRIDHQVKIHGHRVELGEVEAVLKEAANVPRTAAVGWPKTAHGYQGIAAFLECEAMDTTQVISVAEARLPSYMVPKKLICVPNFPLNSNGKVDRNALRKLLGGG